MYRHWHTNGNRSDFYGYKQEPAGSFVESMVTDFYAGLEEISESVSDCRNVPAKGARPQPDAMGIGTDVRNGITGTV